MRRKKVLVAIALLLVALAGAAAYFVMHQNRPADGPIPSRGGSADLDLAIDGIPYYLQDDPKWGAETIGGSDETMAAAGCTVTCTAMALAASGYEIDPDRLRSALKERDGFTRQGYLVWGTIGDITDGKVKVEFPSLSHDAIERELQRKRPVITKIMLGERIPHWVLIVGKRGQEYLIMDPLRDDRTVIPLSERASAIHSVRVLRRL